MADPRRVFRAQPRVRRDFFVYGINFGIVLAGTTAIKALQLEADSIFELQKLSLFADSAGAPVTQYSRLVPRVTVDFQDYATSRRFLDEPVELPCVTGDGQVPFNLPSFLILPASGLVLVTLVAPVVEGTYNMRLALIGAKVFNYE